jgi:hypothetical protein
MIKNEWLAALRSSTYKQGRSRLRSPTNCFCCLGVLADLTDPEGWIPKTRGYSWKDPNSWALLPNFPGLDTETQQTLSEMNDAGWSFAQIADWIEENVA